MLRLDIFSKRYIEATPVNGVVLPSDINYLRRVYAFNKNTIEKYYQEKNFAVKNTHILSRILGHFPVYINYDTFRYIEYSLDKLKYLAKHFKFTSDIEKGVVHPGYFYGNQGEEIIISSYELFNVTETLNNWKNCKSVYTLQHHRNDSKLLLPLGTDDGSRTGLSTLMINLPKLALQFREFNKQQINNKLSNGIVLNKNHFVIKYVLSNMLDDIVDHMLLNKVINKFYGIEEVKPKFRHRFKVFEPTTQLNRYVDQTLDVITSKKLDFINILRNIQLIFKSDASKLLCLPDISETRNIKNIFFISRLDYMIFLYDISRNNSTSINRHYLNDWKRLAICFLRNNNVKDMFSYETEKNIMEKIYIISNF